MTFKVTSRVVRPPAQRAEPRLPSLPRMATNLGRAAIDVVKGAISGEPVLVELDQKLERLAVCQKCELFRASDQRCSHPKCGCSMRAKTWLKAMTCPAGKW